jgi:hypothetical protein
VIRGIDDDRQKQPLRIGSREACIPVRTPLHRSAHAVAVAEVDVVAHPDLVAVIDDRRSREREEQAVHQMDPQAMIIEKRREPPPDTEIDPRL